MFSEKALDYKQFSGHGKLLLTSEYFVLDGALALALPTKLGQALNVKTTESYDPKLYWKSYSSEGKCWASYTFELWHFDVENTQPDVHTEFIKKLLKEARKLNPHFLRDQVDYHVETRLDFPIEWGLGSSSTLVYNVAQWAYVSPFELQFKTLGGSGYDIACAQALGPILYEKQDGIPRWECSTFDPSFKKSLFFVYSGHKQSSLKGIELYRERLSLDETHELVIKLSSITKELVNATTIEEFDFLIQGHEKIVSQAVKLPMIQETYFSDFWGSVKSLGAWGGDFFLATSTKDKNTTAEYFAKKGFDVLLDYDELILSETSIGRTDEFIH